MTILTAKDSLGKAIGRISSGIYIVTTGARDQKQGMLASWIMQASFEPPAITVAVQQDREIIGKIEANRKFVVNILSEGNTNITGRFAQYRADQFDDLNAYENEYGTILKDTVAYLSCELADKWKGGDHFILLGNIVEGEVINGDLDPWTHLRKSGFVY